MRKIFDISNPYEKISYHDFTSNEERYASEICYVINKYNSEQQGFYTSGFPKELLNDLHFEILSKSEMIGKRHLISISLKHLTVNFSKLHIHMMTFGISKEFNDKNSSEEKKYLTVWI
jgi:hypothetical protein